MFERDHKLSAAERAVQRKVRDGQRLTHDDRRIVQARLKALQRHHLEGVTGGIPSGAESITTAPNVSPAMRAMNATANGMVNDGQPDFGGQMGQLETSIRQINNTSSRASFSFSTSTSGYTLPINWTVSGSFSLGPLHYVSGGAGTTGGSVNTGGGTGSGNTSSSGYGAGAGGGQGGGASASVPVSGATVGAGQSNSSGVSGGISGGGSASTGVSTQGTAAQGSSGNAARETYRADITCEYTISFSFGASLNPLSWGAALTQGFSSSSSRRREGSAGGCGWIQFTVAGAG